MHLRLILLMLIAIAVAGCDSEVATPAQTATAEDWLDLKLGDKEIIVQVAITEEEQRQGLMYRNSMDEDSGMLFPYTSPRQMAFWMANTPLPLDIGFFDGTGLLLEVHRMAPNDLNSTRSKGTDMQYALEMNSGWFSKNKLFPGQRLDMELLATALQSRGENPEVYGILEQD